MADSTHNSAGRQDPFAVLGLEARFDLDLELLAQRHRDLSSALHPDRFAAAPASERRQALDRAINVNAAWRTLKEPLSRAEALLRVRGVVVDERGAPQAEPALLLKVMEAREELAEVRSSGNVERVASRIGEFSVWQQDLVARLSQLFAAHVEGPFDTQQLSSVQRTLVELRYCQRLLEEAHNLEHDLS